MVDDCILFFLSAFEEHHGKLVLRMQSTLLGIPKIPQMGDREKKFLKIHKN
jgi:hypothetical protein